MSAVPGQACGLCWRRVQGLLIGNRLHDAVVGLFMRALRLHDGSPSVCGLARCPVAVYSTTTAVPLADTISMPLSLPSTS